jgi:hypothetical protein
MYVVTENLARAHRDDLLRLAGARRTVRPARARRLRFRRAG